MVASTWNVPALPGNGLPQPSSVTGTSSLIDVSIPHSSRRKSSRSFSSMRHVNTAFHTWVGRVPIHWVTRAGESDGVRDSFAPRGPPENAGR